MQTVGRLFRVHRKGKHIMDATDTLIDTFQMASLNLAIWMIARDLAQDICQKYECNVPDSAKEPSQYYPGAEQN